MISTHNALDYLLTLCIGCIIFVRMARYFQLQQKDAKTYVLVHTQSPNAKTVCSYNVLKDLVIVINITSPSDVLFSVTCVCVLLYKLIKMFVLCNNVIR